MTGAGTAGSTRSPPSSASFSCWRAPLLASSPYHRRSATEDFARGLGISSSQTSLRSFAPGRTRGVSRCRSQVLALLVHPLEERLDRPLQVTAAYTTSLTAYYSLNRRALSMVSACRS
jgi:hypothetical protein